MSYRIAQDSEYVGNDYWRWSAWIEADDEELEKVRKVTWLLHPTFKRTRVTITDRASKFQLKTAGWGTFLLRAEVTLGDGEKRVLKHHLKLNDPKPNARAASARSGAPTSSESTLKVFLSYSVEDARVAAKVRAGLKGAGIDVLDQTTVQESEPAADAVRRLIAQSDAVLALICDNQISPWVLDELAAAVSMEKRAIALVWQQATQPPIPSEVETVRLDGNDIDQQHVGTLMRTLTSVPEPIQSER